MRISFDRVRVEGDPINAQQLRVEARAAAESYVLLSGQKRSVKVDGDDDWAPELERTEDID